MILNSGAVFVLLYRNSRISKTVELSSAHVPKNFPDCWPFFGSYMQKFSEKFQFFKFSLEGFPSGSATDYYVFIVYAREKTCSSSEAHCARICFPFFRCYTWNSVSLCGSRYCCWKPVGEEKVFSYTTTRVYYYIYGSVVQVNLTLRPASPVRLSASLRAHTLAHKQTIV